MNRYKMDDKIFSVAQLALETRRLISQVEDHKTDIDLLNLQLQDVVKIMEEQDQVLLLSDDEGNQFIGLLDLDTVYEVNEDDDYLEIELDDIVDTWIKFEEVFGNELLERAKKLVIDLEKMFEKVEGNLRLMQRIQENLKELVQTFKDDFGKDLMNEAMTSTLNNIEQSIDSGNECLADLQKIQRIFPMHDNFLTLVEEERSTTSNDVDTDSPMALEESRPFPNAWA